MEDQQVEPDNAHEPEDPEEDRDPVEIPLNHGGGTERRGDATAEHVRKAAALALVQQHQQDHHQARDDQDDRHTDDHRRSFLLPSSSQYRPASMPRLFQASANSVSDFSVPADPDEL